MDTCPLGSCPACRLSHAIRRAATTKAVAGAFLLWLIFEILISVSPFGTLRLQEITGGPTIVDMTFTTGPESVHAVLAALGEAGRAFDLHCIVPLDMVFPFTYALFFALAISWALSRLLPEGSPLLFLNLAPVIAAAADYCENAGVIMLLIAYPAPVDPAAWIVSVMFVVKFAFFALSLLALLLALAGLAIAALLGRARRSPA
jgi:hypothetical protein